MDQLQQNSSVSRCVYVGGKKQDVNTRKEDERTQGTLETVNLNQKWMLSITLLQTYQTFPYIQLLSHKKETKLGHL